MSAIFGIRREDKHEFERRAPLTPPQVRGLCGDGIRVKVQPSALRAFTDDDYRAAGAEIDEELVGCGIILGVKEIPVEFIERRPENTLFAFFSHTIKGQPGNMPMLRKLAERRAHLIDYERIVDDQGRRLVLFGHYAGVAGMIDALWALGKRLDNDGFTTALGTLKPAHAYEDLPAAERALDEIAESIERHGWPADVGPIVSGFAGYGNVSRGAQQVLERLHPVELTPDELLQGTFQVDSPFYKVIFREEHLVETVEAEHAFELQDYYRHPDRYCSVFQRYLPHLSLLVNAIYWDERYPRLITKQGLSADWGDLRDRLRVIADITCDVGGAIECTVKATDPGNPVYVFEPATAKARDGVVGDGPVILAVDTLPCELPKESSTAFGEMLQPFIAALAAVDLKANWDEVELPGPLRTATILWDGALTDPYRYLSGHLTQD